MPEWSAVSGTQHPDLETLSSYVDTTIDHRTKTDVERHLADCERCLELVTEVMSASVVSFGANGRSETPGVLPFPARKRVWLTTSVAAAAALFLVLAVSVQQRWVPFGQRADSITRLVGAVGQQRTVEGRLTGGFAYAPLQTVNRSNRPTAESLALRAEAAELQQALALHRTQAALHALGIAQLLLGRHDEAIVALDEALSYGRNAALLSDYSAARLARGDASSSAYDWRLALDAASEATQRDPALLEAHFNRALAATRIDDANGANSAWEAYLTRDTSSPWAEEARQHLGR